MKTAQKQSKKNKEVSKIKSDLPTFCAICGKFTNGDAAHLVPKSAYPEHYTNPLNIVRLCRECHVSYDNNIAFRQQQTKLFNQICQFDALAAHRYFKL